MRHTIAILLACTLAACGSSGATDLATTQPGGSTRPNISGAYTLKSIDGKPLPVTAADSTITAGLLTISDSTWKQLIVLRYALGGSGAPSDSLIEEGRWDAGSGSKLTLFGSGSTELYSGTYSSTGFTLSSKTSTLVYSK